VQDESDPAQDISDEEEDEGRTLDRWNPAWSEGARISRDTQGNEIVLATPDGSVEEDPEALGGGDETQLGEGNEEEEEAAHANIPAVAPQPYNPSICRRLCRRHHCHWLQPPPPQGRRSVGGHQP
jgi:hypothetical protein